MASAKEWRSHRRVILIRRGKSWDVGIPGGFRFQFVKHGDAEFRLRSQAVNSESGPVVAGMVRRGMVRRGMMKAEEIGAA